MFQTENISAFSLREEYLYQNPGKIAEKLLFFYGWYVLLNIESSVTVDTNLKILNSKVSPIYT